MEINQLIKKGKINAFHNLKIEPSRFGNSLIYLKTNDKKRHVKDYILSQTNCSEERIKQSFLLVNLK